MRINPSDGHRPSNFILVACITLIMAIWAVNYLTVKFALRYLEPLTLASFRVVGASIFMLAIYPIAARLPAFSADLKAHKQPRTLRDLFTFAYLGFFCISLNQMCFTVGLRHTSVAHSSIILGMGPIYALILAALFRLEKLTLGKALGMAVSFIGVAILVASLPAAEKAAYTSFIVADPEADLVQFGLVRVQVPQAAEVQRRPIARGELAGVDVPGAEPVQQWDAPRLGEDA